MFKALLAIAAITVCCIGNEYPAKADAAQQAANAFVRMGEEARQEQQLRQIVREELNAAQYGSWD